MSDVYTLSEPLILPVRTTDGEPVDIDIIAASDVVAGIQKTLNTTDGEPVAEQFRPWLARKMNVAVESLSIGQVIDLVSLVVDAGNHAVEEAKKKRETMLSSLFSSPESPPTTENGQEKQSSVGSEITPGASLGQSELREQ